MNARGAGLTIALPRADRSMEHFSVSAPGDFPSKVNAPLNRIAFAAAHVVADPLADSDPWLDAAVDWDRTIAFREHLWDLGFGVAEAMDTAQRGMGMSWPQSLELIRRSVAAAKPRKGLVFSGAGTDQLAPEDAKSIDDVIRAYEEQIAAIEAFGGRIILMASRALARVATSGDDYRKVYGRVLSQVKEPVIIHWLGDMFDPALAGYWGTKNLEAAMDVAVEIINAHASKVDGVKISLLDKDKEIAMRRRLAKGVRMYTGDDFNYAELIAGDDLGYSDALLGIFDAIAPAAAAALVALVERRWRDFPRHSRADGAAVAAYLPQRRPASTRPVWCSWPISTAIRIISPWSAARRARARRCIWPRFSGSLMRRGCCAIRSWRSTRMRAVLAVRGVGA